jgi:hypothetical protein
VQGGRHLDAALVDDRVLAEIDQAMSPTVPRVALYSVGISSAAESEAFGALA